MSISLYRLTGPLLLVACLMGIAAAAEAPTALSRQAADDVVGLLASDDADMRAVAYDTIRHGLRGEWFTRMAAEKLPSLAPADQALLLLAFADRGDAAAVPAATAARAASQNSAVRAAAVTVIGRLGGAADVATLMASLAAADTEREAARRGLVEITGAEVAAALRAAALEGPAASRVAVIDALAERRDRAALPMLVKAAVDDDSAVRSAAMRALARFGGPDEIPAMAASLLMASGDERRAAELAIATACTSGRSDARAVEVLVDRYRSADADTRRSLLPALARVGGPQVMAIVDGMLSDPVQRPQGLEALSKWPDATVSSRLLDLLAQATEPKEKDLLLGALIRIAPLPDNKLSDAQKLELLRKTMALCTRTEDRARVIERANAIRTIETFRFVLPYLDDPTLAEPACRSVVELAHHQKLRDAHKEEFLKALDRVLGITKNEELVERAKRYKAGQTWDRAKKS